MNTHASKVIDALGGTAAVSRLCEISMPSVSDWKHNGIPAARMQFFKVMYRRKLAGIDLEAATIRRKPVAKPRQEA